ncbi:MAG: BamA/TamA family outer membrane protein, partial [Pseudomonadota bacterium]
LKGEIGSETTRFTLSFTEPWLFDIPLTAGARIYNLAREFDAYDRDSKGGSIWFGYPILKDLRINLGFSHDAAQLIITDPDNVPKSIQDLVDIFGTSNIITNSVDTTLRYDTRDRIFSPTEGSNHFLTVKYAGFGGDIGFTKYIGQLTHYFPMFWDFVFNPRVKAGYVFENSGFVLPDYEKFFLGGINSMRGYDEDELQPRDSEGNKIGGDKQAFANFNLIYPIAPTAGLDGIIFFDVGAVVDSEAADLQQRDINGDTLRKSVGLEVRWNSPMGPIRLAYGWKIDPREGEDSGRWEFAMGAAF